MYWIYIAILLCGLAGLRHAHTHITERHTRSSCTMKHFQCYSIIIHQQQRAALNVGHVIKNITCVMALRHITH